ncbi:hypothetical protein T4C_732 [Trichinella pseudospiralis]|uniref:Uncharacterized protein n=1 Tax=Trichinella pseudospiralis TaxID=6337 RepID=A0A0V1K1C8_TRIPS|nr:hypothetical protein T4C_732 [Trichinella pseudospiralis]
MVALGAHSIDFIEIEAQLQIDTICLGQFFEIFEFFRKIASGAASGYASGHKKICISPQATPWAFYCTIFASRLCKNLHM